MAPKKCTVISLFFRSLKFSFKIFRVESILDWRNRPRIFLIYIMNKFWTGAGAQRAFIERKEQRAASRYHRYYTFTLAIVHCCRLELAFPPRTAVHTPRVRATVLNIRMRKCFDGENVSQWNNIRVTNFRTTSAVRKYFHYEKRLITVYELKYYIVYLSCDRKYMFAGFPLCSANTHR